MTRTEPADGDGWVVGTDGRRFWGRFGAAGLLLIDTERVLLQHRAEWSHFGGTWGLPGGARHGGESALQGALRESAEEAGVPGGSVRAEFSSVLDLGIWSYTTVVARTTRTFEPVVADAESIELRWVPVEEVDTLPLHPGFAAAWPRLRALRTSVPVVVVDVANTVGSRPDGWWRDRVGATERLLDRLEGVGSRGLMPQALGIEVEERDEDRSESVDRIWPALIAVVEGAARAVDDREVDGTVRVRRAEGSGDDEIVAVVAEGRGPHVVVTADRELAERVTAHGATTIGPGALLDLLDAAEADRE